MGTARLAYHGDHEFTRAVQNLIDQIEMWERPKWTDAEVIANWNARMAELKPALKGIKEGKLSKIKTQG